MLLCEESRWHRLHTVVRPISWLRGRGLWQNRFLHRRHCSALSAFHRVHIASRNSHPMDYQQDMPCRFWPIARVCRTPHVYRVADWSSCHTTYPPCGHRYCQYLRWCPSSRPPRNRHISRHRHHIYWCRQGWRSASIYCQHVIVPLPHSCQGVSRRGCLT